MVLLLVSSVVGDGCRHISVHLAEQDHQALVLALSHQAEPGDLHDVVLPRLHELGAASCGTELTPEGRQIWAVLDCAASRPTSAAGQTPHVVGVSSRVGVGVV
ncbi:hypothetical protein OG407_00460 [Streptomyces sp. NBC_01515]|uniref:hypothetical protein n=1 Tax=Streptomyces sp. NBC_01515 TaxID=2903890 RepID=UPI0038651369